jgi:hypothetical protein
VHLSIFNPASMHSSEKLGGFTGGSTLSERLSDSLPPPPQEAKNKQVNNTFNFISKTPYTNL